MAGSNSCLGPGRGNQVAWLSSGLMPVSWNTTGRGAEAEPTSTVGDFQPESAVLRPVVNPIVAVM